jgi:hypothetical protein
MRKLKPKEIIDLPEIAHLVNCKTGIGIQATELLLTHVILPP